MTDGQINAPFPYRPSTSTPLTPQFHTKQLFVPSRSTKTYEIHHTNHMYQIHLYNSYIDL